MRHHFIPRFYLQNWADSRDNKLVEFSRRHGAVKRFRRSAAGAGFQTDLYVIDGEVGLSRYIFETGFLSGIDGIAASALRKIVAGDVLNHRERTGWIIFLLSLAARSPASVETLKEVLHSHLFSKREEIKLEAGRLGENIEYVKNEASFEAALIEESCKGALSLIRNFATNADVIRLISRMHWKVLRLEAAEATLLTSDRPLLMTNGLDIFNGQLILPLSPSCAFVAFRSRTRLKQIFDEGALFLRDEINKWIINQAVDYVYAQDERLASDIAANLGSKARLLYVDYRQAE